MRFLSKYFLLGVIHLVATQKNAHYAVRYFVPHLKPDWNHHGHTEMCLVGRQGPCADDQYFGPVPRSAVVLASCENYGVDCMQRSNSSDCVDISSNSSMKKTLHDSRERGICIWSESSQHPCRGYPANYRYYDKTGKCHPLQDFDILHLIGCLQFDSYAKKTSVASPCQGNTFFKEIDRNTGDCDCARREDIYWAPTDECYQSNTQGPCNAGQWIVLDRRGKPRCQNTSCPVDGNHVQLKNPRTGFIGCYIMRSEWHDPNPGESPQYRNLPKKGPCKKGQLLFRRKLYPEELKCQRGSVCSMASHVHPIRSCVPGSKLFLSGKCKVVY